MSESGADGIGTVHVNGSILTNLRWVFGLALLGSVAFAFDRSFVAFINPDNEIPLLDSVARWLDLWSTRLWLFVVFTLFFAAFVFERWRWMRPAMSASVVGWMMATAIVQCLKLATGRPRPIHPEGMSDQLRSVLDRVDLKSFPSGHSATAFVLAVIFCMACRNRIARAAILCLAAAIALGRSYIGAHYLSDICFGAAIGWGAAIIAWRLARSFHHRIRSWDTPRALLLGTIFCWAVTASWMLQVPLDPTDAMTGEELETFRTSQPVLTALAEPVIGFGTRLSGFSDLKSLGLWSAVWAIAVVGAIVFRLRRRSWPWAVGLLIFAIVTAQSALGGFGWQGKLKAADGDWVYFEMQSHIGDPVDGHMDMDQGLERFKSLGFDVVVPTWHCAAYDDADLVRREFENGVRVDDGRLHGIEWSTKPHSESPLHILCYRRGQVPLDVIRETDWRAFVKSAKAAGCVVVLSHFWRGDEDALPSMEELRAAGVDGFEIAGRCQEDGPEAVRRLGEIRAFVRQHALLGLVNSDFHGRRTFNYQWNAVERRDRDESDEDAVWRAISDRDRKVVPVVLHSFGRPESLPDFLMPPFVVMTYLLQISPLGRLAWVLLIIGWGWYIRRRARASAA